MKPAQNRLILVSLIAAAIVLFGLLGPAAAMDAGPPVGADAPEIGPCEWFQREAKQPVEIARLKGQVVLVHMFAVGCVP